MDIIFCANGKVWLFHGSSFPVFHISYIPCAMSVLNVILKLCQKYVKYYDLLALQKPGKRIY